MFIKNPLLRIKVVGHPGSDKITFDPPLDHTKVQVARWFHSIINVNYQLPSIDAVMYPSKNLDRYFCFIVYLLTFALSSRSDLNCIHNCDLIIYYYMIVNAAVIILLQYFQSPDYIFKFKFSSLKYSWLR